MIALVPIVVAVVACRVHTATQLRRQVEAEFAMIRGAAIKLVDTARVRAGKLADQLLALGGAPPDPLASGGPPPDPLTVGGAPPDPLASGGPPPDPLAGGPPQGWEVLTASHPEPDLASVLARRDAPTAQRWLDRALGTLCPTPADVIVLADADGGLLAAVSSSPPSFAPGAADLRLEPEAIARAGSTTREAPGILLKVREVRGQRLGGKPLAKVDGSAVEQAGYVITGVWADRDLLAGLSSPARERGVHAAFVSHGRVLAALHDDQAPPAPPAQTHTVVRAEQGEQMLVTTAPLAPGAQGPALLLWTPAGSQPIDEKPSWLLLAWPVLTAAALGWFLGDTAVMRLARMGRGRDELRESLFRLGQTLSSSLDLGRTLAVVVETAMEALAADRAVLMLLTPERDALYPKVGRGIGRVPRVRLGQGLAGWVAQSRIGLRLPADAERAPPRSLGEPGGYHQLLVPMPGGSGVIGVLSLIRDDKARPFTQDDLDVLMGFAAQASIAIENVLLHREAQRLSVTDPLTGLWNLRYLQIQADREVGSAVRFQRPLSLAIIDIDRFKEVNDRLGHQAGDEVLIEVARRIRDSTRIPDIVARYGGEEFVVLLPGTDLAGALATAERIRGSVAAEPVTVRAGYGPTAPLPVTCSGGVSSFPVHGQTFPQLLRVADAALRVAKTRGRNQIVSARSDE